MEKMPKNEDSIFSKESDWHNNACLNFSSDMSFGYIDGYKLAADLLISNVIETANNQDTLVYPIIFLYRQHIELLLKNIILHGRILQEETPNFPTHHNLMNLWNTVKGIINFALKKNNTKEIIQITNLLVEFSEIDPQSMAFRYPMDQKGNIHNPTMKYVNLRKFGEKMIIVSDFLCGVDAELEQNCANINEYRPQ